MYQIDIIVNAQNIISYFNSSTSFPYILSLDLEKNVILYLTNNVYDLCLFKHCALLKVFLKANFIFSKNSISILIDKHFLLKKSKILIMFVFT